MFVTAPYHLARCIRGHSIVSILSTAQPLKATRVGLQFLVEIADRGVSFSKTVVPATSLISA
jgi:hypothetical protein